MSISGRLTLAKSVLGSLRIYYLSLFPLPAHVNKQLESIRVRFFWGIDDNEKKIQWVKWDIILNSKEKGGLDVGSLWAFNQANALVFEYWCSQGWNIIWRREIRGGVELSQHTQLMSCIQAIRINLDQDVWQWKFDDEESFTVRSVRNSLDITRLLFASTVTRWCKILSIKVNVFVWRAMLNRLPTRINLDRRGIDMDSLLCPCCNTIVEDSNHVFYSCNVALELWNKIAVWLDLHISEFDNMAAMFQWIDGHDGGVKGIDRVSPIKSKDTGNSDSPRRRRITMSERDKLVSSNPEPVSQFSPITGELIMSSANDKAPKHKAPVKNPAAVVYKARKQKTPVKKPDAVVDKAPKHKAPAKKPASVVVN
ncbi:RNA-directed DNA polymerase, eukaryota, partial [Tanacetum coccineum]